MIDTGLGMHVVDFDTAAISTGTPIDFTMHWLNTDTWEGINYHVETHVGP